MFGFFCKQLDVPLHSLCTSQECERRGSPIPETRLHSPAGAVLQGAGRREDAVGLKSPVEPAVRSHPSGPAPERSAERQEGVRPVRGRLEGERDGGTAGGGDRRQGGAEETAAGMSSAGVQIFAFILALLGIFGATVATLLPNWKVSADMGANIITAISQMQGLWMDCTWYSTGMFSCTLKYSVLSLPAYLQTARTTMVLSCVLAALGLCLASLGLNFLDSNVPESSKFEPGGAVYVAFVSSGFLFLGGAIFCVSCSGKRRGPLGPTDKLQQQQQLQQQLQQQQLQQQQQQLQQQLQQQQFQPQFPQHLLLQPPPPAPVLHALPPWTTGPATACRITCSGPHPPLRRLGFPGEPFARRRGGETTEEEVEEEGKGLLPSSLSLSSPLPTPLIRIARRVGIPRADVSEQTGGECRVRWRAPMPLLQQSEEGGGGGERDGTEPSTNCRYTEH
ncbi:hypothetical protein SKAU_G00341190 [Synaphobranchus kaupii]|uniref:Claudin n=1 Tax=Synaphobranchus kaupii TaxID=118154 RepID=A0A9Q1EN11_SYNKA|nr:hypothetical protein SKAU_G00341190 [Synaphobranchus kaupii]